MTGIFGDALLGVYLHGSAASGGLRPQSDIDLLAVTAREMTGAEREKLLAAMLRISGRHPAAPGNPRCVELVVFHRAELAAPGYPPRAAFVYGEWLRDAFEAGEKAASSADPEYTLVLAQARRDAVRLLGPPAGDLLPEISGAQVRQAMGDALPALIGGLRSDERNVLLTLARMWRTASDGGFATKDAAAGWAMQRLGDRDRATLDHARKAYLGEIADDWDGRQAEAQALAEELRQRVVALL